MSQIGREITPLARFGVQHGPFDDRRLVRVEGVEQHAAERLALLVVAGPPVPANRQCRAAWSAASMIALSMDSRSHAASRVPSSAGARPRAEPAGHLRTRTQMALRPAMRWSLSWSGYAALRKVGGMPAFGNWPCSGSAGRPSCSSRRASNSFSRSMPVRETHAFQHEHQVLGDHVAGGAGRVRAAAQPGQAGIERADTLLQPGQGVGDAEAAGVVQMQPVQRSGRSPHGWRAPPP